MAKLGTVQFIAGVVKAVSVNGQERILHAGDKVQAFEKIITGPASSVVVIFDDGTRLDLGRDSQMQLSTEALTAENNTQPPTITDQKAQHAAQNEVDALQKALQDDKFDPSKGLPATAAGAGTAVGGVAGGANNGHTFVLVDYLNPQLTPNSGFNTQGINYAATEISREILLLTPQQPSANQVIPIVPPSVISVVADNPVVTEGADLVYTVTLSASTVDVVTYPYALGGGTASASDYLTPPSFSNGVTYDPVSQTITVPTGVTSFTVIVPTVDDTLVEGVTPETLPLSIGGVTGIGQILDNDSPSIKSIVPTADSVVEGNPLTYTVTLSEATVQATTYPYALGGGTASASDYLTPPSFSNGVTYDPVSQTITVPTGVSSFSVIVPTVDDTLVEGVTPETLPLSIGGVTGIGQILDNDSPSIKSIVPTADSVVEGNPLTYTVTLSEATVQATTYPYALGGGTASASDYLTPPSFSNGVTYDPVSQTITVPTGVTSFTVIVPTVDDTLVEGVTPETLPLSIGGVTGIGQILDNDSPSIKSIVPTADSVVEGNPLTYTVTLSEATVQATTYPYALGGGTASASDYLTPPSFSNGVTYDPVSQTITVPTGVTSFTVIVPTVDDTLVEGVTPETLPLSIGGVTGIGQILDNDSPSIKSIVPTADSVVEGNPLTYTVTLSEATVQATTYPYALGGGTASASDYLTPPNFSNGVTYDPVSQTITVPTGVTSFTVIVPTVDDTLVEGVTPETLPLSIGGVTGIGQILDNDSPSIKSIVPTADSVVEGNPLTYTVTLSEATVQATTYPYALGGGTASASDYLTPPSFSNGVTYDPVSQTITVPTGVTSFTVIVPTVDDTLVEGVTPETLPLSIGGVTGIGQILDNDSPSIKSIVPTADSVVEGNPLTYTVTLSEATVQATTYPYALGGGTASASDYLTPPSFSNGVTYDPVSQTITVPTGVTSFSVIVPTVDDTLVEGVTPETLPLSIGGVTGIGQILDNDSPSIKSIVPTADSVVEGNPLTYTVTLSEATVQATTYPYALGGGTASASDYLTPPSFSNGVTYDPVSQTITVPTGVTSFTVIVPTVDDTLVEGVTPETLPLSIGGVTGIGQILDNDHINLPPSVDLDANNSNNIIISQPIAGLFNTGVDNNDTRLAMGLVDSHYTLISKPSGSDASNITVSLPNSWLPTDVSSKSDWIGSTNDNPVGSYAFQTSFDLSANVVPETVKISFDIAFDNTLSDILINGVSTGLALTGGGNGYGFSQYTHVELSGASGLFSNLHTNTITFIAENRHQIYQGSAGPTGIRIDNMQSSVLSVGSDPINHQSDYAAIYIKGSPISIADSDTVVNDADSSVIKSATITLTNQQSGDVLLLPAVLPATISATTTGNVIQLSGSASFADYQQAIKSIQFSNTSINPNTSVERTITVTVNDGKADSNVATTTVHVVVPPIKPELDLNTNASGTGYSTVYATNGASVAISDANTLLADINSMIYGSVTIHIANLQQGDELTATQLPSGIHASTYDSITGTLSLSGNATPVDFQTAIHNVNFSNVLSGADVTQRLIEVTVSDGSAKSNTAVTAIDLTNNTINGNNADNILSGTNANDAIFGNNGNDTLTGGNGNDVLNGGNGNDTLKGDVGNDILNGGDGNDILYGGAGNDVLTGGAGINTFVWNAGDTGTDTVTDFKVGAGADVLNIADLLQDEHSNSGSLSSFLSFSYDQPNNTTTITIDADKIGQGSNQTQAIVLQNVDLTASGTLSTVDIINNLLANGNIHTDT